MTKRTKLKEIVKCCEKHFDRGSALNWKHSDFLDLHKAILEATNVNISGNTLKRIFGKIAMDEDYIPQRATIDALKQYGGYREPVPSPEEAVVDLPKWQKYKAGLYLVLTVVIIFLGYITYQYSKVRSDLVGSLKLLNTEGTLPATAFFSIDFSKAADSVFIDFGDKSPLVHLPQGRKSISHNYLFPGVFRVLLLTRKDTLSFSKVSIRSDKWVGQGYYRQADLPRKYFAFPASKTSRDSIFHIDSQQLMSAGLDTAGSFFTRLSNFTDVGEYSDHFVFESVFKNSVQKGISCKAAQVQITGATGMIRFKLVNKGCSSYVLNIVGEKSYDGKIENLSRFTADLENWNTLKIQNNNKQVQLFLNGTKIYQGSYTKSIGRIKGLYIEFAGNGYIKKCDLKSVDGKTLLHF